MDVESVKKTAEEAKRIADQGISSAAQSIEEAKRSVDQGISSAAHSISQGVAYTGSVAQDVYSNAVQAAEEGRTYVDQGLSYYKEAETAALHTVSAGLHWAAANPYIAYPAATAATLFLFPFTRRLLYRQTVGRLRSPESVVRSCEGRVKGIAVKLEEYNAEVSKLQERMFAAEAEYKSGLSKLKATRLELQRLSGVLGKGEKSATGVVQELRTLPPKLDKVLELRGEAAGHASSLRSQRRQVDKWVYRIASQDI